jgi:hypothetical protein
LCLAALDDSILSLYLSGGLVSFRSIVETLEYQHPFANIVPKFLHHTDLPQLTALLAGRIVTLAGTVDGANKTMDVNEVKQIYGDIDGLNVLPESSWDVESLSGMG